MWLASRLKRFFDGVTALGGVLLALVGVSCFLPGWRAAASVLAIMIVVYEMLFDETTPFEL